MSDGFLTAQRIRLVRLIKYAAVSVIATATSLAVLGGLVGVVGFPSVWANVIATTVGTVPSFELNRRWVWSETRGNRRMAQVVPFCMLSGAGLAVSSLAVHLASDSTATWGRMLHTVAIEAANVCSYGVLWVAQFVVCDRVLFRASTARPALSGRLDRSPAEAEPGPGPGEPRPPSLRGDPGAVTVPAT